MQLNTSGNFEIKIVLTREVALAPELPGMCFTPVPFPIFLEKNEDQVEECIIWNIHFPLIVCKLHSYPALWIAGCMLTGIEQEAYLHCQ